MTKFSALILGASFIICTYLGVQGVSGLRSSITVKGYSETEVKSDVAVWRFSFGRKASTLSSGYTALENDSKRVQQFLFDNSVSKEQVDLLPVTNYANYKKTSQGRQTNEIETFTLTQSIVVTSTDVENIQAASRKISSLFAEGIGINSQPPQFYFNGLNKIKVSLLKQAAENAEVRARAFTEGIGALKSARQGVFQITAPNSTDVSDYGTYDTSSIDKTVKAVITAEFYTN